MALHKLFFFGLFASFIAVCGFVIYEGVGKEPRVLLCETPTGEQFKVWQKNNCGILKVETLDGFTVADPMPRYPEYSCEYHSGTKTVTKAICIG